MMSDIKTHIEAGVYFHIPFCRKACHYCNFHFSTSIQEKSGVVEAIIKEIDIVRGKKITYIKTVYFGGGTPSMLLRIELRAIMEKVRSSFDVDPNAEITFEVNPDDMSEMTVPFWKKQGINRLSIGIQSFRDEDLVWMNRTHNAAQALDGIRIAKEAGFENISIDLIYGIPGLSDEAWIENIKKAIALNIPHISAYALTVEPKTALKHMIETGKTEDVDPAQQSKQFIILMEMLEEAGYEHYEISNFAKQGMRSRHNSSYWVGTPYFGFGPAAHSFDGYDRYWNVSQNRYYSQSINVGIIPYDKETLTDQQRMNEYVMTSLRMIEGISLDRIEEKWGTEKKQILIDTAQKYIDRGMVIIQDNHIRLTREGKLFADGIASDFFILEKEII